MSDALLLKGYSVSVDQTVEWVDTDASGHQHNSVVIRWVEAAEAQLMRDLDLPDYFPNAPRVQHVVNFRGMLWFGQRARTSIWIASVGRTSLTFGFNVTSFDHGLNEGSTVSDGTVATVYVPQGSTSAEPWPEEMKNKFEQVAHCLKHN